MILYLVCIALHILAVMVWIGHMIFWTFIVGPVTKRMEPQESREKLREISIRKGGLGWPSLAVLVVTGLYLLSYKGVTLTVITSGDFFTTPFGKVISLKLFLVIGMIAYQAFVGHRAAPKLIFVNMLAAMLIIALSILLVRSVKLGDHQWIPEYPQPFLKKIQISKSLSLSGDHGNNT